MASSDSAGDCEIAELLRQVVFNTTLHYGVPSTGPLTMISNVLFEILCATVFAHTPVVTGSKSKLKWRSEDGHIVEAILAPSSSSAAADSKSTDKEKQVTFVLCHK